MIANITVITDNLDYLLWGRAAQGEPGGVLLSVLMAIGAAALAFPGGIGLACLAWRFGGWPRKMLFLWAELIRGIPLIFVIFWLWFLLPWLTGADLPGAVTVTLALAWFSSASVMYSTLSATEALPKGQYEAALSGGFSSTQTLRLVLLPQALRNALPSFAGLFIALLKDTSLAFIVNVPELTTVAGQVNNRVQVYPAALFIFTGLVYFLLCSGLEWLVKRWQRRPSLAANEQRHQPGCNQRPDRHTTEQSHPQHRTDQQPCYQRRLRAHQLHAATAKPGNEHANSNRH